MDTSEEEIFKWVDGYEGLYKISSYGRVLSVSRDVYNSNGDVIYRKTSKFLSPFDSNGYLRVILCKNGKSKKFFVHRLVAEAFICRVNGKDFVNHKDGVKCHNEVENLEWVTPKENIEHAHRNGLAGEHPSKIPEELKKAVIEYYVKGSSDRGCVKTGIRFGIGKQTVLNIVKDHHKTKENCNGVQKVQQS